MKDTTRSRFLFHWAHSPIPFIDIILVIQNRRAFRFIFGNYVNVYIIRITYEIDFVIYIEIMIFTICYFNIIIGAVSHFNNITLDVVILRLPIFIICYFNIIIGVAGNFNIITLPVVINDDIVNVVAGYVDDDVFDGDRDVSGGGSGTWFALSDVIPAAVDAIHVGEYGRVVVVG